MKKRFVVFLLIFVFAFAITSFRLTAFAEDSVAISSKVSEIELDIGASYDIDDLEIKVDSEGDYSVTYALPDNDTVAALENGVLTALTQGYTEITVTAGSASIVIPVYIDLPEYYYYDSEYLSESIVLQNNGGLNSELLADNGSKYLRVKSEKAVSSGRFDLYTMINPAIAKAYPVLKIVYRSNIGGVPRKRVCVLTVGLIIRQKRPATTPLSILATEAGIRMLAITQRSTAVTGTRL